MEKKNRRQYLKCLGVGITGLSGCLSGSNGNSGVTQEEFDRLERRVKELEETQAGGSDSTGSDREGKRLTESQVIISENGTEGVFVFGTEELSSLVIEGATPRESYATTENPRNTPIRIGGENPDLRYVPGGDYEIIGRVGNQQERIMVYTAPEDGVSATEESTNESEEGQEVRGDEQEKRQEEPPETETETDVIITEREDRNEVEIYVRKAPGVDSLIVRDTDGNSVSLDDPSGGDTLQVGSGSSDLEYSGNEKYTIVSIKDGTEVTVEEFVTSDTF